MDDSLQIILLIVLVAIAFKISAVLGIIVLLILFLYHR